MDPGTYQNTVTAVFSCLDPQVSSSGSKTIDWHNGETSTFTFNSTFTTLAGEYAVLRVGAITAGKFEGATATEELAGPTLDVVSCSFGPGITSRTSVGLLTIVGA